MNKDSSQLKIGDKIEIIKINNRKYRYKSQILDILDEKKYIISGPIRRSTIIHISVNTILKLKYYQEGKGKYVFNALVTDKNEKGIYNLTVERLEDITRIQERDYFRLSLPLNVIKRFEINDKDEELAVEETCITKDISGGGARIFSNYKHRVGEKMQLSVYIGKKELILFGVVVGAYDSTNDDYNYEIGVKFYNIDEVDRDIIVKYIFEQQRKLRRKGLI